MLYWKLYECIWKSKTQMRILSKVAAFSEIFEDVISETSELIDGLYRGAQERYTYRYSSLGLYCLQVQLRFLAILNLGKYLKLSQIKYESKKA
jgi:hypothetical protein